MRIDYTAVLMSIERVHIVALLILTNNNFAIAIITMTTLNKLWLIVRNQN